MKYVVIIFSIAILLALAVCIPATAQVPHTMSYQGLLTTSSGIPVTDGLYTLQFKLDSNSTGGSPIWTETQTNVPVSRGTFSVILGSATPGGIVLPRRDSLFVEVTATAGPIAYTYPQTFAPRSQVTSAPYSLRAQSIVGPGSSAVGEGANAAGVGATANANYATIGGGIGNLVDAQAGTVAGGWGNQASGNASTISGGSDNRANGQYPTVAGGRACAATGDYSFAAGRRARAINTGTFVWADGTDADFTSGTDNSFLIRASGGVGIGANNPYTSLHVRKDASGGAGAYLTLMNGVGGSGANVGIDLSTYDPLSNGGSDPAGRIKAIDDGSASCNITFSTKVPGVPADTLKERMRIASSGNVGIGTPTPAHTLDVAGDVNLTGNLTKSYAGTTSSAVPIAFGQIKYDATVFSATANVSCVWDASSKGYLISINGVSIDNHYVTIVTPSGAPAAIPLVNSMSGKIWVGFYNLSGVLGEQRWFQFVTYKP
jgi:hypothetical protein